MHSHAQPRSLDWRLKFSLVITIAFMFVEFAGGVMAQSLALISDAAHNFTDALALGLAWFAHYLGGRPPDESRTFGYQRAGVLAALLNAVTLIGLSLVIAYESYQRLLNPRQVEETIMFFVAAAGLAVNLAVMRALHADCKHDLNIKGAYLHMLGDALGSVGIIAGAVVIHYTGLMWIDPLLSFAIAGLILWTAWSVARESVEILLEGVPRRIRRQEVQDALRSVEGVIDIHDLHIWSLSSSVHALSCHAVIDDVPPSESSTILGRLNKLLRDRFQIAHTTIQFEHVECAGSTAVCSGGKGSVLARDR